MSDWKQLYNEHRSTAEAAAPAIQSGARVFLSGNCSVPQVVLRALVDRAPSIEDVTIIQVLTLGDNAYVRPAMQGHLRVNTMFISDNVRQAVNNGCADFTSIFLSEIPALLRTEMPPGVALIHVSLPDEHGYCSFGIEVGITKTAAEVAQIVI